MAVPSEASSAVRSQVMSRSFRKLFIARISVAIAPLVITVPLAIILRTYWALVIGNLCGALVNSIVLSVFSNWKPSVYYSFKLLKKMFSYSFWSLCEALANWTIFWVDTFIVGNYFSEYQLGLYKNSTNVIFGDGILCTHRFHHLRFCYVIRVILSSDPFSG